MALVPASPPRQRQPLSPPAKRPEELGFYTADSPFAKMDGDFYADKVRIISEEREGATEYSVQMLVWLAPFDLGVSQYMQLDFVPSEMHQIYPIEVFIERISGETASWKRVNQRFMNVIRKQFLIWRTVDADAKTSYREQGSEIIQGIRSEVTA